MSKTEGIRDSVIAICVCVMVAFAMMAAMRGCEATQAKDKEVQTAAVARGDTVLPGGEIIGR